MNKNQKILTIVALAVFSALIVLHYCSGIRYESRYRSLQHMSLDGKAYAIRQGNKVIWEDTGSDPDYPYDPELKRVMLEFPGRGWYLDRKPVIRDVRIPLLTLAVFYAGLFFILATPSAKRP